VRQLPERGMSDALIRLEQVGVSYGGEAVLDSIDLSVAPRQIVTLIGPNGAGKTTLVRAVLGLLKPHRGTVWRKPKLRIGYMPQKIQVDATLPLSVLRFLRLVPGVDRAAAVSALQEVGAEQVIDSPIQTISGGEMQRVLLARAVAGTRRAGARGGCGRPDRAVQPHHPAARPPWLRRVDGVARPAPGHERHRPGGVPQPPCLLLGSPGTSQQRPSLCRTVRAERT